MTINHSLNLTSSEGQRKDTKVHIQAHCSTNVSFVRLRAHSHCRPSRAEPNRTEPIRLGKQTHVMKWKHSHCTPNRAEPNWTEPDRACSLADVCFYSPGDDRFCCAVGLTSGGRSACFKQ